MCSLLVVPHILKILSEEYLSGVPRLIGQFLYNRELAEVVGNQQVVVRTILKYV